MGDRRHPRNQRGCYRHRPARRGGIQPAGGSASVLGGVKAAAKGSGDTVPVKVDSAGNLYVPTYPSVPTIPKAANQADSVATEVAALVTDFNGLLAKLKAAGLMTAD